MRKSMQPVWPSSEANLYREQKRLVSLGWAAVTTEHVGRRPRKRYTITDEGRRALEAWLRTEPAPPALGIEGVTRLWFADQGSPEDASRALRATAEHARHALDATLALCEAYAQGDGAFPDRGQVNSLTAEIVSDLLGALEHRCLDVAVEIDSWSSTRDRPLDGRTRERLDSMMRRHRRLIN